MPLFFDRTDPAKITVDAVVLPANPWLEEGQGLNRKLFAAAGRARLADACQKLGHVDYGRAVITQGFDLPAKYIVHAVVPMFQHGDNINVRDAKSRMEACYIEALRLAASRGLFTVGVPLLSSGNFRWPKKEALQIATTAILKFLAQSKGEAGDSSVVANFFGTNPGDMSVYLLLSDEEAAEVAKSFFGDAKLFADEEDDFAEEAFSEDRIELVIEHNENFCEAVVRFSDKAGLSNERLYVAANLSKQQFSMIINEEVKPDKNAVLSLSVALKLNLEDTRYLLATAGYELSDSSMQDGIVAYHIQKEKYDITEINLVLHSYGQTQLGGYIYE
ncbi:MAG: macro domain-containing protein [Mogibacterium sp.]|nr:macro domain-containing protein [Mogibacterium sp.]